MDNFIDPARLVFAKAINASIVPVKAARRKAKRQNAHIARPMTQVVQIWMASTILVLLYSYRNGMLQMNPFPPPQWTTGLST